jgi:hypothetical protein
MSGPHRNEDKLNTIGIVVVGICGAVLVYCTIVALQAFYVNDTSEVQTMADYGGNETTVKAMRADQVRNISEYGMNGAAEGTYHMPIERAMQLIVDGAKNGDAAFVPAVGPANCRTSLPIPGRGHPDPTPGLADGCPGAKAAAAPAPAAPAEGSGSGAPAMPMTPTNGNATGGTAGSAAGTGSAAPAVTPAAPPPTRGHAR